MDSSQFREFGKAAVDWIADYMDTVEDRAVLPSVSPGYLKDLIPEEAPQSGESWQDVLQDVETVIMPGMTHWMSPHFHAFFPSGSSFPTMVGEMLSAGFAGVGISWIASPAYTELEVVMMNWLGKMLGLPNEFLNCSEGPGGGVIQNSASEAIFVALLAAKEKSVRYIQKIKPLMTEAEIKGKLVAYSSDQSNSCVEKAGLLGSMKIRLLPSDAQGQFRGKTLLEAIQKDRDLGLIPCYVVANLGTTQTCAFDKLEELGPVCQKENLWLHIDAAYAGTAFACPEYRYLMKGIEYTQSFSFNPHKWMLVNFDCSAFWVKDARYLVNAFSVQRIYLRNENNQLTPEYRDWQISLGRRFRALKLWFVLRIYGVEGIQKHVREHVVLAKYFEKMVRADSRFEIFSSNMGLVTIRLKGSDQLTINLVKNIESKKRIFVMMAHVLGQHVLRFAVCSRFTRKKHIDFAWNEIQSEADKLVGIGKIVTQTEKTNPAIRVTTAQNNTDIGSNKKSK